MNSIRIVLLSALTTMAGALSGAEANSTNPPSATTARAGRNNTPNSNDVFYTLGPDSQPRPGVPKGYYTEAKVIPSDVFPGNRMPWPKRRYAPAKR